MFVLSYIITYIYKMYFRCWLPRFFTGIVVEYFFPLRSSPWLFLILTPPGRCLFVLPPFDKSYFSSYEIANQGWADLINDNLILTQKKEILYFPSCDCDRKKCQCLYGCSLLKPLRSKQRPPLLSARSYSFSVFFLKTKDILRSLVNIYEDDNTVYGLNFKNLHN